MSDLFNLREDVSKAIDAYGKHNASSPIKENRVTAEMRRLKEAVDQARLELKHSAISRSEKNLLYGQIFQAAQEEVKRVVGDEVARLDGEFAKEKQRLARDRELNSTKYEAEISAAQLRFSAMSDFEIKVQASEYLDKPSPMIPEVLDLFSAELRRVDPADHQRFREAAKARKLYEPERFTETGAQIVSKREALGHYGDGTYIPIEHEDGSIEGLALGDMLGGDLWD